MSCSAIIVRSLPLQGLQLAAVHARACTQFKCPAIPLNFTEKFTASLHIHIPSTPDPVGEILVEEGVPSLKDEMTEVYLNKHGEARGYHLSSCSELIFHAISRPLLQRDALGICSSCLFLLSGISCYLYCLFSSRLACCRMTSNSLCRDVILVMELPRAISLECTIRFCAQRFRSVISASDV